MGREEAVDTDRSVSCGKMTSVEPLECNSVNADTRNSIYTSLHRRSSNAIHYATNRSSDLSAAAVIGVIEVRYRPDGFIADRSTPLSHDVAVELLPNSCT